MPAVARAAPILLKPACFERYVAKFNRVDLVMTTNAIPQCRLLGRDDRSAAHPLVRMLRPEPRGNLLFPLVDLPQTDQVDAGGLRRHGILPSVPWAQQRTTPSGCALGHHIYEGRWLHDPKYLNDYIRFWFHGGGSLRTYSNWIADAIYHRSLVSGDFAFAVELLPDLVANYHAWEKSSFCGR